MRKFKTYFSFKIVFYQCLTLLLFFLSSQVGVAQKIMSQHIIPTDKLANYLKPEVQKTLAQNSTISQVALAKYFREKFSERYFFDWQTTEKRFEIYEEKYEGIEKKHTKLALDHLAKYPDSTQWILPFNYQNGEPVTAYTLRHLARQHKMVDIAFYHFFQNKDPQYIDYFTNQMHSLNVALEKGEYEKIEDGNGVYEAFRSGYRALNWLQIHNLFLGQKEYSDVDQLQTIATLLQHGEHLFERNEKFKSGNHQTRGMSALAMLSILFRDFEGTDKWYERSMDLLQQHLEKEINEDGFQFERSVHYHMSDIGNYYYVYQLAKLSEIKVDDAWEKKLKTLFTTLTQIAYPNKFAPVLQDDTDDPWAVRNDISGALTLGYLLFEDPKLGYFANDKVAAKMYWYLNNSQLDLLKDVQQERPTFKSLHFPITGYYIMREGWKADDKMMIISAGLDDKKPDHQHGDMLGIQAMANGKVILPNYQVRYSLKDFDLFKNSMVKNVALVDEELQGKKWTSNKGGSGFGKFKSLPNPKTIAWKDHPNFDLFVGSHDGFENIGVKYSRQVISVNDDFWIVKDNFSSAEAHTYKQVWQGHYSQELAPNLLRATFDDASGCDIFQLNKVDKLTTPGARGKAWSVVEKSGKKDFEFVSIIFPYRGYSNRIDEESQSPELKGWQINLSEWEVKGEEVVSLTKDKEHFFFGVSQLTYKGLTLKFSKTTDVYVSLENGKMELHALGDTPVKLDVSGLKEIQLNGISKDSKFVLSPSDVLVGNLVY